MNNALSVQQPHAWLIVNGYKPIENRNWFTKHRGKLYIHASLKFDLAGYKAVQKLFPDIKMPAPAYFEVGGIVGEVQVDNCITHNASPWRDDRFNYGWELSNAKPIPLIQCKGKLGLFDVTEVLQKSASWRAV